MSDLRIEQLTSEQEWEDAFPVMMQLWGDMPRTHTVASFVSTVQRLQDVEGYRLFALYRDETIVALAGVSIRMSAWFGKYVWVYDLVTDAEYRSHGYGRELLTFLKQWGRSKDCETIALASSIERDEAHRFYVNTGLEKSSYVFRQRLEERE